MDLDVSGRSIVMLIKIMSVIFMRFSFFYIDFDESRTLKWELVMGETKLSNLLNQNDSLFRSARNTQIWRHLLAETL